MYRRARRTSHRLTAIAGLLFAVSAPAAGTVSIENAWARATAPGQRVSGGYLSLLNAADRPDQLLGASSPVAGEVQIHQTSMDGGVMRMRHLPDGIELPANGRIEFKPGGAHLMFMQLRGPLEAGATFPVQLRFRDAGTVDVAFRVQGVNPAPAAQPPAKPQ